MSGFNNVLSSLALHGVLKLLIPDLPFNKMFSPYNCCLLSQYLFKAGDEYTMAQVYLWLTHSLTGWLIIALPETLGLKNWNFAQ